MKMRTLLITVFALLSGSASFARAETYEPFDPSSVIVATNPIGSAMRIYSDPFADLGIAEIKNLDAAGASQISLFSVPGTQVLKLTLESGGEENVLKVIDKLNELPTVKFAEPNYIYTLSDLPDDTYYVNGSQTSLDIVGAKSVWDMDIDCSGVTIAITDSGVDISHPDLSANIWTNPGEAGDKADNGIDDDGNGFTDDVHGWNFVDGNNNVSDTLGHGTHVAGIAGAVTNNASGIASLTRKVSVVPLKVFSSGKTTSSEFIYLALKYANDMGFDIINSSFGGSGKSQNIMNSIQSNQDALFVCAAGNETNDNDIQKTYPASYDLPNVLSVASTDNNDSLSSFSNYGKTEVDIAAPGENILSTYIKTGTYFTQNGAVYSTQKGTSMACPLVSSAAAVIKAAVPDITPSEIIRRIMVSSDTIPALSDKVVSGGRLNLYAALTASPTPVPSPTPEASPAPTPSQSASAVSRPTPDVPEATAEPAESPEPVVVSRSGGEISVRLNMPVSDSDVLITAAVHENGILRAAFAPEVKNLSADFTLPEGIAGLPVTLYIWDSKMRPYLDAPVTVPEE